MFQLSFNQAKSDAPIFQQKMQVPSTLGALFPFAIFGATKGHAAGSKHFA
jgi:hypothetical protein